MMNRRTGQLGRDIGKRRCAWGFRNHYGWWWIGAFMLRSCDALIATSCGAPALMIALPVFLHHTCRDVVVREGPPVCAREGYGRTAAQ
jgi:hypothetical protein